MPWVQDGHRTKELGLEVDRFRMQSDAISAPASEEVKDSVRKVRGRFRRDAGLVGKIGENATETVDVSVGHLRRKEIREVAEALTEGGMNALKQV